MKTNAMYSGLFLLCFGMNAHAQQTPICAEGTITCTGNSQQPQDMGDTTVDNSNSTSQATQVNPSSNTNGGDATTSAEQKAQNSSNQRIEGQISNGSDQAYAHGGTSTSKGNETSVSNDNANSNNLKQGNTGDQTASAKGGNVGDTSAAGGKASAEGGRGGSAGVAGSGNSRSAGGAATGGQSGAVSTNDNRQFSSSSTSIRYGGYMAAVTQPVLPVAVAGTAVQFIPGQCGPRMTVVREWVQVGKKKYQGFYSERLTGIDTAKPYDTVPTPWGPEVYGYAYTAQTSVNSASKNAGLQLGGMSTGGAAGQFGIGGASAGQGQQTTFVATACKLESRPVAVAPEVIYREVPVKSGRE